MSLQHDQNFNDYLALIGINYNDYTQLEVSVRSSVMKDFKITKNSTQEGKLKKIIE
jgi:hypothetical protein